MSHLGNEQFTFVSEIVVVAHLTSKECIGTLSDSCRQEKATSSAAKSHTAYLAIAQCIVAKALYTE